LTREQQGRHAGTCGVGLTMTCCSCSVADRRIAHLPRGYVVGEVGIADDRSAVEVHRSAVSSRVAEESSLGKQDTTQHSGCSQAASTASRTDRSIRHHLCMPHGGACGQVLGGLLDSRCGYGSSYRRCYTKIIKTARPCWCLSMARLRPALGLSIKTDGTGYLFNAECTPPCNGVGGEGPNSLKEHPPVQA
jgi:hypothetical protein